MIRNFKKVYCLFSYKSSTTIFTYTRFFCIVHFNICSTLSTFCYCKSHNNPSLL